MWTDPAAYAVVFDVNAHGYVAWRDALVSTAIGLMALVYFRYEAAISPPASPSKHRARRALAIVVAGLFLWTAGAIYRLTWAEYRSLQHALVDEPRSVVEGRVEDFVPGGPDGHPEEEFRVGEQHFHYYPGTHTSAFNMTAGRGGPVRPGLLVRIHHAGPLIARLEIAR